YAPIELLLGIERLESLLPDRTKFLGTASMKPSVGFVRRDQIALCGGTRGLIQPDGDSFLRVGAYAFDDIGECAEVGLRDLRPAYTSKAGRQHREPEHRAVQHDLEGRCRV